MWNDCLTKNYVNLFKAIIIYFIQFIQNIVSNFVYLYSRHVFTVFQNSRISVINLNPLPSDEQKTIQWGSPQKKEKKAYSSRTLHNTNRKGSEKSHSLLRWKNANRPIFFPAICKLELKDIQKNNINFIFGKSMECVRKYHDLVFVNGQADNHIRQVCKEEFKAFSIISDNRDG